MIFGLISCEREVSLEVPTLEGRVFLLSNFSPEDELLRVTVGATQSALSTTDSVRYISDAQVTLTQGEEFIENLVFRQPSPEEEAQGIPPHYSTVAFSPQPGSVYQVEVDAGVFGRVTAEGYIPNDAPVFEAALNAQQTTTANGFVSVDYQIELRLTDPPNEENYYHLNFYQNVNLLRFGVDVDGDGVADTIRTPVTAGPLPFAPENDMLTLLPYINNQGALLRDREFDGTEAAFTFNGTFNFNPNREELDEFVVELRHVTSDYYDYHSGLVRQVQIQSGFDPISGAVILSSNVENGFGVFSGYHPSFGFYEILED